MKNREQLLLGLMAEMLAELNVIRSIDELLDIDVVVAAETWLEDKKIRNSVAKLWRDSAQFDYDYKRAKNYVIKNLRRQHNLTEEEAKRYFSDFMEA